MVKGVCNWCGAPTQVTEHQTSASSGQVPQGKSGQYDHVRWIWRKPAPSC